MLKPGVYVKDGIVDATAYFEKLGTGVATKSRHGEITQMNLTHTQPSAALADFHVGYWANFDEAKTNIEVRINYAKAATDALGVTIDRQIFDVLDSTSQSTAPFTVTSQRRHPVLNFCN